MKLDIRCFSNLENDLYFHTLFSIILDNLNICRFIIKLYKMSQFKFY